MFLRTRGTEHYLVLTSRVHMYNISKCLEKWNTYITLCVVSIQRDKLGYIETHYVTSALN